MLYHLYAVIKDVRCLEKMSVEYNNTIMAPIAHPSNSQLDISKILLAYN